MGTDIHFYVEKKIGDKWEKIEVDERLIPDDRNPDLFDEIQEHDDLLGRGLPVDTSFDKDDNFIGEWGVTYFYLDEAGSFDFNYINSYFNAFFESILPRICGCNSLLDMRNVRVLVGFDN